MIRPNEQQLAALNRLYNEGGTDFQLFLEWFTDVLKERENEVVNLRETIDVFRAQGSVRDLREILNKLSGAGEILERKHSARRPELTRFNT